MSAADQAGAFRPERIYVERGEERTPLVRTVLDRLPDVPVRITAHPEEAEPEDFAAGKRILVLRRHRGTFLHACPAGTTGLVCCNYLVVNLGSNCPLDCTYCFLQQYVRNNPALKLFTNVEDALDEVARVLDAHPQRSFRIGTGELMDSLALDPATGLSRRLVPFFAGRSNAVLELKTKTDCVGELLGLDPRGRVVVSWSVNTPAVIASEERGTASLEARLEAARRVIAAGYRVGFHFDPLIEHPGWEAGYAGVVERIFAAVDPGSVAWVSLGSLRMTPQLETEVRRRGLARLALGGEMVPCADGKKRVWRGLRLRMYRHLREVIESAAPAVPIYLCMEQPSAWRQVMGESPSDRALGRRLAAGAGVY